MEKILELKNLTPHVVRFADADGRVLFEIEPETTAARARQENSLIGHVCGLPVYKPRYGAVDGLPEPREGVGLIVSSIVFEAARASGRSTDDLFVPDTGPNSVIRDQGGNIFAVKALLQLS